MMKIRNIFTLLFLLSLSVASVAQNMLPLPPQATTFTGNTRGYFFTAPVDFTITEVGVPTDASNASQSVVIVTMAAPPPAFAASTTNYTTEFLAQNVPGPDPIAVNIPITAGTVVGVLGTRGTNSTNSYGQPNPFNTTLLGEPVSLTRFLMQADLQFNWPFPVSTEPFPNSNNIGRVNITVEAAGGGGGGECNSDPLCNSSTCLNLTCPPDETVACIDDVVIDANDAIASGNCGVTAQWVSNPCIIGAPGCPGTTYTYIYKALDSQGNLACCERVITIDNTPAVVTVPPGGAVECYEDVEAGIGDASVTNDCADYELYFAAPIVNGVKGCPGAEYIFTYRVIDVCGRTSEATRTFTQLPGTGPVITSVQPTIVCDCLAGINPNEDLITYTTSCGLEGDVDITGPQIFGPIDCNGTIYRYTYTVTDECGRTSAPVTLDYRVENSAPTFSGCHEGIPLQYNCEDYGGEEGTIAAIQAYIASVEAYSACGEQLNVFNNFNNNNINTCINNGYGTITFRATDNCGRTSFCMTEYIVVDTEAPVIYEQAEDHWEICNYNSPQNFQDWVANHGGAEAYDECSTDNIFWSTIPANPSFNCMGAMGITSQTVTFVVRDNCGNSTSTEATFNAFMGGGDFTEQESDNEIEQGNVVLYQNNPNPFKSETSISFKLPTSGQATLTIYDINGRLLKVIQNNFNEGFNEVSVNKGELGATGVMYYRLTTDTEAITKTMLVID